MHPGIRQEEKGQQALVATWRRVRSVQLDATTKKVTML